MRAFCIAKGLPAYRHLLGSLIAMWLGLALQPASGQAAPSAPASGPRWIAVPRVAGRLHAAQIGLVINSADPYSVAVGDDYQRRRGLTPAQVLRVELPLRGVLSAEEFDALRGRIARYFGPSVQALALAWVAPYAVQCNSITGALALGYDGELCKHSCSASRASPYFDRPAARPFTELGLRPSMLLAAPSVEQARALIERGIAADGSLRLRGRPPANALFIATDDAARRVRMALYPPAGALRGAGVDVHVVPPAALAETPRVLLAMTGSMKLRLPPAIDWLPGALADHLTSSGGVLAGDSGQSSALEWIASGATASYGSVSEPCNHLQKFPHPQLLLLNYLQGATAIEAYWRSVAWPQQGLFIGEPLAAPFAPRR